MRFKQKLGNALTIYSKKVNLRIRNLTLKYSFLQDKQFSWKRRLNKYYDDKPMPDMHLVNKGLLCCDARVFDWKINVPKLMNFRGTWVEWEICFAIEKSLEAYLNFKSKNSSLSVCSAHKNYLDSKSKSHEKSKVEIFYCEPSKQVNYRFIAQKDIGNRESLKVVLHGDLLKARFQQVENVFKEVDFCVHYNPLVSEILPQELFKRAKLWPGYPYPDSILSKHYSTRPRKQAILFSGSSYRSRDVFLQGCDKRGIPVFKKTFTITQSGNDGANLSPDYQDYLRELSQFELIFANGYKSAKESVLVGKVIEAVLVGTTVLYESGSWIDQFFTPYKHYVPVRNARDLALKADYLLKHTDISRAIAAQAFEFYVRNFSSNKFWSELENALMAYELRRNNRNNFDLRNTV